MENLIPGLFYRNPLGQDSRIVWVEADALYAELSRKSLQQVILPRSRDARYYFMEVIPRLIEIGHPLEVGVLDYLGSAGPGESRLRFSNGRHRTASLVKMGLRRVPVACNNLTACAVRIIEQEFRDGIPPSNALSLLGWRLEKTHKKIL